MRNQIALEDEKEEARKPKKNYEEGDTDDLVTEDNRVDNNDQETKTNCYHSNVLGPVHTLLDIASQNEGINSIYCHQDYKVILSFVNLVLSTVVGRRRFSKRCDLLGMRNYVTASDEAFAMLVLENNAEKWSDENENVEKKCRRKARYSQSGESKIKNPNSWTDEGIARYLQLYANCMVLRKDEEKYKKIEDMVMKVSINSRGRMDERTKKAKLAEIFDNKEEDDVGKRRKRKEAQAYHQILLGMANGDSVGIDKWEDVVIGANKKQKREDGIGLDVKDNNDEEAMVSEEEINAFAAGKTVGL